MNRFWVDLLVALGGALLLTPLAALLAHRVGIVDRPGPLKPQARPVAYFGGLAVAVAAAAPALAAGVGLRLLGPAAALALGLTDDCADLPAPVRLGAEVVVGVLVAVGLHRPGPVLGVAAVVITVVLINGTNVIDGLDGLAGGVGAAAMLGFSAILGGADRALAASVAGALLGFLAYNRPPARIYLGDAGSYFVGTVLAELLVAGWGTAPAPAAVAGLLLVAYPGGELFCSVVRRRRGRVPLMRGDRDHTYDRLVQHGLSIRSTSLICTAGQAALAGGAVAASVLTTAGSAVLVGLVAVALAGGAAVTGLFAPTAP